MLSVGIAAHVILSILLGEKPVTVETKLKLVSPVVEFIEIAASSKLFSC